MSFDVSAEAEPVASTAELVEWFRAGGKPRASWRVGTESEAIGVYASGPDMGRAPPYEGPRGIGELLARIARAGWTPVHEDGNAIALTCGDAHITLEPGGQLELAARPVESVRDQERDLRDYERVVAEASRELGIAWLGLGFRPFGTLADMPWMPKARYRIMRAYLPTRGALAHEMMQRTATTQVSVDYGDADDARAKLRCVFGVSPILTALYASSPIVDGALTDYQSYRAHVWRFTDPDRCGLLPLAFQDGDVFAAYAEWALDVPMFFVRRGAYRPAGGMTFRRFLRDGFAGERATLADWELHLSTLFPDARLKRVIEVRGCDGGKLDMIMSLAPLCRGLLYDDDARAGATALTATLSIEQRLALAADVPVRGLSAPVGDTGRSVGELARELVALADRGLGRVAPDERRYLEPLREIAATGRTRAHATADAWRAAGGDPARLISSFRRFA